MRSKKQLIRMVAKSRHRVWRYAHRYGRAKTSEERKEAKRLGLAALDEFLARSEALKERANV